MGFFKKLFGNRFFVITLCAAVLISIIPAVLTAMGQKSYVQSAFQTVASPFQWCFTKIGEGLSGYSDYFRTLDELRRENIELRQQLEDMNNKISDANLLEDENDFLRAYLGTHAEHTDFEFTDAVIVGCESTNYSAFYTLAKGSLAGIEKRMPVITDKGLLGYISEVGPTWSRVTVITETDSSVGVYISRSGVSGVLEGNLSLRLEGKCRMIYIEADSDVRIGDTVITSGVGSFYPRGISVGRVTAVSTDSGTRTLVAEIEPYASIEDVNKVMIITSFEVVEEKEAGK